jgi:hypothetical protein
MVGTVVAVVVIVVVVVVVELSTNPLSLPLSPEFYTVSLAWYTQTVSWKGCYYHGTVAADRDFLPLS